MLYVPPPFSPRLESKPSEIPESPRRTEMATSCAPPLGIYGDTDLLGVTSPLGKVRAPLPVYSDRMHASFLSKRIVTLSIQQVEISLRQATCVVSHCPHLLSRRGGERTLLHVFSSTTET